MTRRSARSHTSESFELRAPPFVNDLKARFALQCDALRHTPRLPRIRPPLVMVSCGRLVWVLIATMFTSTITARDASVTGPETDAFGDRACSADFSE